MEWLFFHMPISGVDCFWPGLLILGFGVGVIGGFMGLGGAWMITPGLNILGFPMAFAIGTDMAHIAGKSIVATFRHGKFGNVDYGIGVTMALGTFIGIEIGAQLVMLLERIGKVDAYVRWFYVILLASMALLVFLDYRKRLRLEKEAAAKGVTIDKLKGGVEWFKFFQKIPIPPMISYKQANIHCSFWLPAFIGLMTGWVAGLLGIGGGLLRMPALVYFIGCPTHIAVGTDLFEVLITSVYGTITYTLKGRTEFVAVAIMLLGAATGVQFGTVTTKYVHGYAIRIVFGIAVTLACIATAMKQIARQFNVPILDLLSIFLILFLVLGFCAYLLRIFIKGARAEIAARKARGA